MNPLYFPRRDAGPMPGMNMNPMMPPAMNGPRELLSPEILQLIASYNQPQEPTWEQILARRYIDALLGRGTPQDRGNQAGAYYPEYNDWVQGMPQDIMEMLQTTRTDPRELMQMMMQRR